MRGEHISQLTGASLAMDSGAWGAGGAVFLASLMGWMALTEVLESLCQKGERLRREGAYLL